MKESEILSDDLLFSDDSDNIKIKILHFRAQF